MRRGHFYFLKDEYCQKFNQYGVMQNKDAEYDNSGSRPCFYAFPDEQDENIFWMIPVSSKIEKYEEIRNTKIERYGFCDTIEFGYVRGRLTTFLLQNICPVTMRYVHEEYIDCETDEPVSIPNDLQRTLNMKARKIIRYAKERNILISMTDTISILSELKMEQ